MPTINSAATRGSTQSQGNDFLFTTWEEIRDFTSANGVSVNTDTEFSVRATQTTTKLNTTWYCNRFFMAFDTSAITSTPVSATLYIRAYISSTSDMIAVKATSPSTSVNIAASDNSNIVNYTPGLPMEGYVTEYSDYINTGLSTTAYNAIPLTAAALSDMNSLSTLQMALVNYTFDYQYLGWIGVANYRTGISITNQPYIEYSDFNGNVFSISLSTISKVNDISKGNIKKINT